MVPVTYNVINVKLCVWELAMPLFNLSKNCMVMGYRDRFYRFKELI